LSSAGKFENTCDLVGDLLGAKNAGVTVLLLVVDTSFGEVVVLSLRGATVHGLLFVVLILLQRDGSDLSVMVLVLVGWI
jgi:hypothetical protein